MSYPILTKAPAGWQCQQITIGKGWDAAGSGTLSSHGPRAREALKDATYATIFAYLWRRFGPPPTGWDPEKELVNYWLSTPLKGVAFGISCSPGFPKHNTGFFYAFDPSWSKKIFNWERGASSKWLNKLALYLKETDYSTVWAIDLWMRGDDFGGIKKITTKAWQAETRKAYKAFVKLEGPRPAAKFVEENPGKSIYEEFPTTSPSDLVASPHRQILAAIDLGVKDLFRAVPIRDMYINVNGPVTDPSLTAVASPRAGNGCTPEFMDAGEDWWLLAHEIERIGVSEALAQLKKAGLPKTSKLRKDLSKIKTSI